MCRDRALFIVLGKEKADKLAKETVKRSTVEREIKLSTSEAKRGKKQMNSCKTLGIKSRGGIFFQYKGGSTH